MYDICCIGHITLDRVVTPSKNIHMAGGTSFYFSNAIRSMQIKYGLVTAIAETERKSVEDLTAIGIDVTVFPSAHTVYFENIYAAHLDHRTQRVLQTANPFSVSQFQDIEAKTFHLGPLLADDIPLSVIKYLASKGKVSLDVQGYLRKVENQQVCAIDWADKREGLPYIHALKANEYEMEVLTGTSEIEAGAKILFEWGVKEVIITLGSKGSVIYDGHTFYNIKANKPVAEVDATGCGDTYMAGYLSLRSQGAGFQEAGAFAAAISSLNIESFGPFTGTEADVYKKLAEGVFNT